MTKWLHFHFSLSCIGKGNGNPLQCSCLENPRDGGAWWAAIYGIAQSWTRLKQLSSSSLCSKAYLIMKKTTQIEKTLHETCTFSSVQFSCSVMSDSLKLFATLWITARQASLSITNSRSSLKFMSIESVMPSSYLILCRPILLLPPIPPSIRVFSNESTLRMTCTLPYVK